MNCKKCGNVVNEGDYFCKQCGYKIENEPNYTQNAQNPTNYIQPIQNANVNINSNVEQVPINQSYNNNKKNSSIITIILCIVLAIIFWLVGFFVIGKAIFGNLIKLNNSNIDADNGYITNIDSNNSKVDNKSDEKISNNNLKNSSYIVTDDGKNIYFKVNGELKEDTANSDSTIRCFDKKTQESDAIIWVQEDYNTVDKYMAEIEDTANRMKLGGTYRNVQLSEIQTTNVNGKKFYYRMINRTINISEYKDLYIAYQIEDESLYTIEIEGYDLITDDELNGLLNIDYK